MASAPPLPAFAPPPRTGFAPAAPPPRVPGPAVIAAFAPIVPAEYEAEASKSGSRSRFVAAAVGTVIAASAIAAVLYARAEPRRDRIVVPGTALKGWPKDVEPIAVLDQARKAAELGANAELAGIETEVGPGGHVDFSAPVKNSDGVYLKFAFLTEDVQADVHVDAQGVRPGRLQPRERCGDTVCKSAVPPPQCTFARILEASVPAGLDKADRAFVKYAAAAADRAGSGPEWTVSVAGRGSIRLDGQSCKPLPREKLRPQALPLAKIPGAPRDVDPLEIVAVARTQSGLEDDAALLEIEARGVRDNGRVDLSAPETGITYIFAEPLGQARRRWRQVSVRRDGMPISADEGNSTPLPVRLLGMSAPAPRCSFAQAREFLTRGIPAAAPARMTYGPDLASGQTGLWTLEIASLPSRRTVGDLDCEALAKISPGPKR
jgi:hypothetical protein